MTGPIPVLVLLRMLNSLSVQELQHIYGLMALRLPWVLVELVIHAMLVRRLMQFDGPTELQTCVEFFSGCSASSQIAKAFTELGKTALAFDISRHLDIHFLFHVFLKEAALRKMLVPVHACLCPGSQTHDLSSTSGLVAAVMAVLSVVIGGLVHLATVCTSFVFINAATHSRSMWCPEGADLDYVELGTTLASRSSLLALLTWAMGATWTLEQPSTSCMLDLQSWQAVIHFFQEKTNQGWCNSLVLRNSVVMAAFRGPTLKPTALWSNANLEVLMNMYIPPKHDRPPPEAPVSYASFGRNFVFNV